MKVLVQQHAWELEELVGMFERLEPDSALEIGVADGGTLREWMRCPTVVAIDDRCLHPEEWKGWAADAGTDLHILKGRSESAAIIARTAELAPFDFLFIDGDHRYNAVRHDWRVYGAMVRPGGLVAFHDIHSATCEGVRRLWQEIKFGGDARTVEIHHHIASKADWRGIGVAFR